VESRRRNTGNTSRRVSSGSGGTSIGKNKNPLLSEEIG
jgi:hypothetical protein